MICTKLQKLATNQCSSSLLSIGLPYTDNKAGLGAPLKWGLSCHRHTGLSRGAASWFLNCQAWQMSAWKASNKFRSHAASANGLMSINDLLPRHSRQVFISVDNRVEYTKGERGSCLNLPKKDYLWKKNARKTPPVLIKVCCPHLYAFSFLPPR